MSVIWIVGTLCRPWFYEICLWAWASPESFEPVWPVFSIFLEKNKFIKKIVKKFHNLRVGDPQRGKKKNKRWVISY